LIQRLEGLAARIDRASLAFGRAISWLSLAMVLIAAFNAIARYGGRAVGLDLSSNGLLEAQWYLFAMLFLLGSAPTLASDRHVRVDVLYGRLNAKRRALIDIVGGLALLLPFCVMALVFSLPSVRGSWAVWEVSPDPGGLPRWPIKTVVPVAFGLLVVQGAAFIVRRAATLFGDAQ